MESKFQNRDSEIETLLNPPSSLVIVYGEAGIGKTRLLREMVKKLKQGGAAGPILWVDMTQVRSTQAQEYLLRELAEEAEGWLHGVWTEPKADARGIVTQLKDRARRERVTLIFDNTEILQENGDFWRWLELHLVGPLLASNVRMIFAGRIPQPWRRFEVRQALTPLPLKPLKLKTASNALIVDVLMRHNPSLSEDAQQQAVQLVNDLAFGHPHLSEEIAVYIAPRWPAEDLTQFRVEICKNVVRPFIQTVFFAEIEAPWHEWLWSMSVLEWFDTTILPKYLERLTPQKVRGKPDYYFIQAIGRLRVQKRILWREERGDCMHGVIGEIVEQCLKVLEPERYRQANIAAAETFEDIAAQFDDDPGIQAQYEEQANMYRARAMQARREP